MSTPSITITNTVFKPTYKNHFRDYIKNFLLNLLVITMVVFAGWLWKREIRSSVWMIGAFLLLSDIIRQLYYYRLQWLEFDTPGRRIRIQYKSLFGQPHHAIINFDDAWLEIITVKPWFKKPPYVSTIYFLKGKVEIYELKGKKDRLSAADIQSIIDLARELSIPVKQA